MLYEVVDTTSPDGKSRFEVDLEEPPKEGAILDPGTMVYTVVRVLPGERGLPPVIEVERIAGPGQVT